MFVVYLRAFILLIASTFVRMGMVVFFLVGGGVGWGRGNFYHEMWLDRLYCFRHHCPWYFFAPIINYTGLLMSLLLLSLLLLSRLLLSLLLLSLLLVVSESLLEICIST